jgi:N6-adenosine-specific RNA methylase IME4
MDVEPCRLLLADPPWKFGDRLPGRSRGAARHYPVMDVRQIADFPLPPLAEEAMLLLWRVSALQQEALDIMHAWGFAQKSEIVWVKVRVGMGDRPSASMLHFGMGRYVRASHESCLVGVRGKPAKLAKLTNHSVRSCFFAPRPAEHSAKPPEFYELAERLFPSPRVELFARTIRRGWVQYGDQLGGGTAPHPAA